MSLSTRAVSTLFLLTASAATALLLSITVAATVYGQELVQPPPTPAELNMQEGQTFDPGAGIMTKASREGYVNGKKYVLNPVQDMYPGFFLPNGKGGYIWSADKSPMAPPDPKYADARELKLKMRELADQLFAAGSDDLAGSVALPVSFVNQDNFEETSSFGRYIAEAMFYECNQRRFPVREYRTGDEVSTKQAGGDFLLSRRAQRIYPDGGALVLLGTYLPDRDNVFVHARLIRSGDGRVLRTGSLVFPQNPLTKRLLAKRNITLEATYVGLKDFTTMTRDTDITSIDLGEDIH